MMTDIPVPGAPRTVTEPYGVRKFTTPLPDLEHGTDDEWLDLAANVLRLDSDMHAVADSPLHVRALCRQLERLDLRCAELEERIARGEAA